MPLGHAACVCMERDAGKYSLHLESYAHCIMHIISILHMTITCSKTWDAFAENILFFQQRGCWEYVVPCRDQLLRSCRSRSCFHRVQHWLTVPRWAQPAGEGFLSLFQSYPCCGLSTEAPRHCWRALPPEQLPQPLPGPGTCPKAMCYVEVLGTAQDSRWPILQSCCKVKECHRQIYAFPLCECPFSVPARHREGKTARCRLLLFVNIRCALPEAIQRASGTTTPSMPALHHLKAGDTAGDLRGGNSCAERGAGVSPPSVPLLTAAIVSGSWKVSGCFPAVRIQDLLPYSEALLWVCIVLSFRKHKENEDLPMPGSCPKLLSLQGTESRQRGRKRA